MAPANISFASEKRIRRQTNVSVIIRSSLTTTLPRAPDYPSLWTSAKHRRSVPCPQSRRPFPRSMPSPLGKRRPAVPRSEILGKTKILICRFGNAPPGERSLARAGRLRLGDRGRGTQSMRILGMSAALVGCADIELKKQKCNNERLSDPN